MSSLFWQSRELAFKSSKQLYREKELSKKLPDMSEDEMFKLLASDGMLVKRPLLVTDKAVIPVSDPPKGSMVAARVSLMRSERGKNGMIYTEIGSIDL